MSDVLDLLRAARERIAMPERWTRHAEARDVWGINVAPWVPSATRWCASGAIWRAYADAEGGGVPDGVPEPVAQCMAALSVQMGTAGGVISAFNDAYSHTEVLALFDRAIAALEAEEVSA